MVCVWLFPRLVFFCGGGRGVLSLAALSSRSATSPVSKTSDKKYAALVYGVYFIKTAQRKEHHICEGNAPGSEQTAPSNTVCFPAISGLTLMNY